MPTYADVIRWVRPNIEFHQHRYARGLAEVVPRGSRWLDIGAGTKIHDGWLGPTQEELASRAQSLVGCDLVPDHLARNPFLSGATCANATALPFASGSFDVVTANMVLEHLEQPRRVFEEIARVLAPGGRFIFVTPNYSNPVIRVASIVLSRRVKRAIAPLLDGRASEDVFVTYYRTNTAAAIRSQISGLPLRIEKLEHFSTAPFLSKPWFATLAEAIWIKITDSARLSVLRTNLFGEIERLPDGATG